MRNDDVCYPSNAFVVRQECVLMHSTLHNTIRSGPCTCAKGIKVAARKSWIQNSEPKGTSCWSQHCAGHNIVLVTMVQMQAIAFTVVVSLTLQVALGQVDVTRPCSASGKAMPACKSIAITTEYNNLQLTVITLNFLSSLFSYADPRGRYYNSCVSEWHLAWKSGERSLFNSSALGQRKSALHHRQRILSWVAVSR